MSLTLEREMAVAAPVPPPTRIVIRRYRAAPHDLVGIMVDRTGENAGTCIAYSTKDKYGEVQYSTIIPITTVPHMNDQDVLKFIEEIQGLGYDPKIIIRYSRPA